MIGGGGADTLFDGGGSDTGSGLAGFDRRTIGHAARPTSRSTGCANDGAPGEGATSADVEDVNVDTPNNGTATLVGNEAGNVLDVGGGAATITGARRRGHALRQRTATTRSRARRLSGSRALQRRHRHGVVDTLDTVSRTCETCRPTPCRPGGARRPAADGCVEHSSFGRVVPRRGRQSLAVTATDDRGVAKVQFFDEDRLLCEDTAAPYTCNYQARGRRGAQHADRGRDRHRRARRPARSGL